MQVEQEGKMTHVEAHLRGLHAMFGHDRTIGVLGVVRIISINPSVRSVCPCGRTSTEEYPDTGTNRRQKC